MKKLLILLLLLALRPCVAKPTTNLVAKLEPVPPFPELRAAARLDNIPLDDFIVSTNTSALQPGDSLATLITLHQKGNRRTQWLVYFQIITASNKPPKTAKTEVLYNSTGDKFEFTNQPVTFHSRAIGPYVDTASFWGQPVAKDKSAQTEVDGGYLSLGIDKLAACFQRLTILSETTHVTNIDFDFTATEKPPSDTKAARNRKFATLLQITPAEERALAGGFPMIESYFDAVGETPNLDGIMLKVASLPSMWSIIKHAGITVWITLDPKSIRAVPLPDWKLPTHDPIYTLPITVTLNRHDTLDATLLVTAPHPPLLACGGIVGFLAQNPDDDENYLTLRVISAHCEGSAPKKAK